MKFITDFHIHSHYSIATSKQLVPEYLDYWARRKGITVVGTGDITHPGWLEELKEKVTEAEPGLFRLKDEYRLEGSAVRTDRTAPSDLSAPTTPPGTQVRFLLTGEISSIYKKGEKVRKVHNIVLLPGFEAAETMQKKLDAVGNITSDGRPILGLDSRDVMEIVLSSSDDAALVPAHIWTPWFSALGSKSGFDTIDECYGDLSDQIFAVETGLSSDPPMNWICRFLDRYTIISNSDAHSPEKLGREANLFDTELSYFSVLEAMKSGDGRFLGTVEFFPQEGKYHYDGHRKCGVRWDPLETVRRGGICPVCGKKVTVGVTNRVAQLADREDPEERPDRHPFYSLVPLKELISETLGVGSASKKVNGKYQELLGADRSEFDLLLHLPISDVERVGGELLAEGVRRMRAREVYISEGYDGEYGSVRVFRDEELRQARILTTGQKGLFSDGGETTGETAGETIGETAAERPPGAGSGLSPPAPRPLISFDMAAFKRCRHEAAARPSRAGSVSVTPAQGELFSETVRLTEGLNREQLSASKHLDGPALVLSGPGTGKTRTLTRRIARLVTEGGVRPEQILAVTFTNKAAREMEERLSVLLSPDFCRELSIMTFHRLGLTILKENMEAAGLSEGFTLIEEEEKRHLLATIIRRSGGAEKDLPAGHSKDQPAAAELSRIITRIKQDVRRAEDIEDERERQLFSAYEQALREYNLLDLDDLLYRTVLLLQDHRDVLETLRNRFPYVSIDEYQDINGAQYALIMLLCPPPNANIFVIGDPNQAIYGFRGADVSFINRFFADYPHAVRYSLDVSYRCSDTLLAAAGQVVDREKQKSRQILKGLEEGVKIEIVENSSDKSEAEFIARRIEKLIGGVRFFSMDSDVSSGDVGGDSGTGSGHGPTSLAGIAVLCRISRQMSAVETAFGHHAIPFKTVEAKPPFEDGPAGIVLKVIKAAANPKNHLLQKILERDTSAAAVSQVSTLIGKGAGSVKEMIRNTVSLLVEADEGTISGDDPRITELLDYAGRFGRDLVGFLRSVALGSEVDIKMGTDREVQRVSIMTLHAAKGLEFDTVFIPGCEDGIIPYSLFKQQTSDPGEERRLLYVGMTRAKREVILSYAGRRSLFGTVYKLEPSRFLSDIEDELQDRRKLQYRKQVKPDHGQLPLF